MNRDWHLQAACRGADPAPFFSDHAETQYRAIRRWCDHCPVRQPCRELADRTDFAKCHGVFGGTTAKQRQKERSEAAQPKANAARRQQVRETARALLAQGAGTNAQIARQLGVGESTISRWRSEFREAA